MLFTLCGVGGAASGGLQRGGTVRDRRGAGAAGEARRAGAGPTRRAAGAAAVGRLLPAAAAGALRRLRAHRTSLARYVLNNMIHNKIFTDPTL